MSNPGARARAGADRWRRRRSSPRGWTVRYGWITPAFDFVAHQFYEVPILAADPPALPAHPRPLAPGDRLGLLVLGLLLAPWLTRHARAWLAIFGVGYAIRAIIWICGGNLPLVPGDSCHYLEVATSVLRGEGPVKHYVESFFTDYPRIRQGQGVLDDWATPLDAYVRAWAFRLAGMRPDSRLEATDRASPRHAASCSTCWRCRCSTFSPGGGSAAGSRVWAMAVLAVLPVHAIYAGFVLRESLVALTSILAVWTLTEVWQPAAGRSASGPGPSLAGLCGGLADPRAQHRRWR